MLSLLSTLWLQGEVVVVAHNLIYLEAQEAEVLVVCWPQ
jgi:hypothetical protein